MPPWTRLTKNKRTEPNRVAKRLFEKDKLAGKFILGDDNRFHYRENQLERAPDIVCGYDNHSHAVPD